MTDENGKAMEAKMKMPAGKKQCGRCAALVGARTETCPHCGHKFVLNLKSNVNKERKVKMSYDTKSAMTIEQFREAVGERLKAFGQVEQTNYHVRVNDGLFGGIEAEFSVEPGWQGKIEIRVDGELLRRVQAENLGADQSVWITVGALTDALQKRKDKADKVVREQRDTDKCLLLLKDFPLRDDDPFRWSVGDGKIHVDCPADFTPDRFADFKDLVEMLRMTVIPPAAENLDEAHEEECLS